jgi:hypothetical protein
MYNLIWALQAEPGIFENQIPNTKYLKSTFRRGMFKRLLCVISQTNIKCEENSILYIFKDQVCILDNILLI